MPSNSKETLSLLQKEFEEKLRAYDNDVSGTVPIVATDIKAMSQYGMSAEDYIQLGPFSCSEVLEKLHIDLDRFKKNKALILGFLADTFMERGFEVNVYNVVPETGTLQVDKLNLPPENHKPELQLSTWDKFWDFLGFETQNMKTIRGLEEAKKREAEVAAAMKADAETKISEANKRAEFLPKEGKYAPAAIAAFKLFKKGDYENVLTAAAEHMRDTLLSNAAKMITEKKQSKVETIKNNLVVDFRKKYMDDKFNNLSLQDKAYTLINIIKTPALLEQVCGVKVTSEKTVEKLAGRRDPLTGKLIPTGEKRMVVERELAVSDASLADYVPDLSVKALETINEVPELEEEINEL